MNGFWVILIQDLRLARAEAGGALLAVQFFAIGALIFPLGLGPSAELLGRVGAGLLTVMALFATLLALERLFGQDQEDGTLDILLTGSNPLWSLVLGKVLAHWLVTAAPMLVVTPLLGLLLQMTPKAAGGLVLALLLGTPTLSLIGAVGASLTLGTRRGSVLLALLVLPLYIPVLIFMVGTVRAAETGLSLEAHLSILAAML
ncbi:MAG TPA: heme exporter protein CcmB, partial [Alphaproteobacteria bacterium]|nr:heme exporter protein CcmB [Alphaproteobacteria bacterium]